MSSELRQMMGGGLRPNDPRRWLIEAMVGAMVADGSLDDRELQVLRRQLEEQDLFAGLSPRAVDTLIDIGHDAQIFAGGSGRRVASIARNLYTRTHRIAAYAMACEVCAADGFIADGEVMYLENLRSQLHVFDTEAYWLLDAAQAQQAMYALDRKMDQLRSLMPPIVDCFALGAIFEGKTNQRRQREILAVLESLLDVSGPPGAVASDLERAFHNSRDRRSNIEREMGMMALEINETADRFWAVVYLMVGELARDNEQWHQNAYLCRLQQIFQLNGALMNAAMETAKLFPLPDLSGAASSD